MACSLATSALSLSTRAPDLCRFTASKPGKPQIRPSMPAVTSLASGSAATMRHNESALASPRRFLGELCQSVSLDSAEGTFGSASSVPTPTLPSGTMMAEFLLAYRRMLQHELISGDKAAAAGAEVLERIRIGLSGLLGHPRHGIEAGQEWTRDEARLEECLTELEKDINMIHHYHKQPPTRLAVAFTSLHCVDAAKLLRKL